MDFLKKLLFPSKNQRTTQLETDRAEEAPGLEISEEDIDNILSQASDASIQEIVSSDSIDSIASLFNHLDELEQIRRPSGDEPIRIGTPESPEKTEVVEEQVEAEDSQQEIESTNIEMSNTISEQNATNITKEIEIPQLNVAQVAQSDEIKELFHYIITHEKTPDKLHESLKEFTTKHVRPDGTNLSNSLSEIKQIDKIGEIDDSAKENEFAFDPTEDMIDQNATTINKQLETRSVTEPPMNSSESISRVLQMDDDLTEKVNTPQVPREKPKHINLGFEEVNININMQVVEENTTKDCDEKCAKEPTIHTEMPIDAKDVVDLTQSDDETEGYKGDSEDLIVESTKSHAKNLLKDQSLRCRNEYVKKTYEDTNHMVHPKERKNENSMPNPKNTTKVNAENNIETIAKLLRQYKHKIKPIKNPILHTATVKEDTHPKEETVKEQVQEAVEAKENVIEIISITSTTDEESDMNTSAVDIIEPDTISCSEIEYKDEVTNESDKDNATSKQNVEIDKGNDYDHCSGYHSSDFEFITESEAEKDGLIINYNPERNKRKNRAKKRKSTVTTIEIAKENDRAKDTNAEARNSINFRNEDGVHGPSSLIRAATQPHVVPEGEAYYHLFRQYDLNVIRFMENKSVFRRINNSSMHVEYDALGQNMTLMMQRQLDHAVDDDLKREAKETAKKIREMYPRDNRKRYRRI